MPSGPVVITDVTVPLEVDMTFIADVPTHKTMQFRYSFAQTTIRRENVLDLRDFSTNLKRSWLYRCRWKFLP